MEITARTITAVPPRSDELGIEEAICNGFDVKNGLIAICGPTGQGKSTLIASQIRGILENQKSSKWILSYESPVEYVYDEIQQYSNRIRQHEIPWHLKAGFAYAVRNSLRRAPDIIVVGECRDYETISAALEASETGHLLLTTIHANSVPEALFRIVNMFPSRERDQKLFEVIEAMRMIVVQWLVPKVGGGRVALREFLVLTPDLRLQLRSKGDLRSAVRLAHELVASVGQTMLHAARIRHRAGDIDDSTLDYVAKLYQHQSIDPSEPSRKEANE